MAIQIQPFTLLPWALIVPIKNELGYFQADNVEDALNELAEAVELMNRIKIGKTTIPDGQSSIDVAFPLPFPSGTSYVILLTAEGAETVWYSNQQASGFTINRSGTTGDLEVSYLCMS